MNIVLEYYCILCMINPHFEDHMNWDTIITLALLIIACIYCIRKIFIKKSVCSSCSSKESCADYYNYKVIQTQCTVKKEIDTK